MAEFEPINQRLTNLQQRARELFVDCPRTESVTRSLSVPLERVKKFKLNLIEVSDQNDPSKVACWALKYKYPTYDETFAFDLDNGEVVMGRRDFVDEQGNNLAKPKVSYNREPLSEFRLMMLELAVNKIELQRLRKN